MTCGECNEGSRYRAFGNTRRSPYLACGHEGWKRGVREGFLVGMGMIRTTEVVCGGQTGEENEQRHWSKNHWEMSGNAEKPVLLVRKACVSMGVR